MTYQILTKTAPVGANIILRLVELLRRGEHRPGAHSAKEVLNGVFGEGRRGVHAQAGYDEDVVRCEAVELEMPL